MKTLRLVILLLLPFPLLAQNVPPLVNYQGRLSNPDGSLLATGNYQLSFSVFDAPTNGNLIWGPEVFDSLSALGHGAVVPVVQGYFNVLLGPSDVNGRSVAAAFNGTNRFVEVTINTFPPIAPRQQILTSPFAFQAATAAGAVVATNVVPGISITNATISGVGAGLTALTAANLTGTVPVARLPSSLAYLGNGQSFTGPNTFFNTSSFNAPSIFNANATFNLEATFATAVGIGTTAPMAPFHVFSASDLVELVDGSSTIGTWLDVHNTTGAAFWHIIATGSGNGEGQGKLLISSGAAANTVNDDAMTFTTNGFVGIATTTPSSYLQVVEAICNGVQWLNFSDRNFKQDFAAINPRTVLEKVSAMPITQWKYKSDHEGATHIGPMAQDFHAAFGLNGADEKHISTADEEGVALAAIQGLNQKLNEKDAEIQALTRRLTELEAAVKTMADKK